MHRTYLLLLFIGVLSLGARAQEICNNGIDDDSDGLIDLNDTTDCVCTSQLGGTTPSIIPNPSFEAYDQCPDALSELNYATTWEQATWPTTDYFNTCGWSPAIMPLPVPDGNACVGTFFVPGWQEYVGACLLQPMVAGTSYTISFWFAPSKVDGSVAFNEPIDYTASTVNIYGLASCPTFPIATYDCPVAMGWTDLGSTPFQPVFEWQHLSITFTPTVDMNAIMIGSACTLPPEYAWGINTAPYMFYDDLTLNASALFGTNITQTGSFCTDDLHLIGHPDTVGTGYQWYNAGVALVGQTDTILDISQGGWGPGIYQFQALLDTSCAVSQITILPPVLPVLSISPMSSTGCPPLTVSFTNTTNSSQVASSHWDFGDGDSSNVANPSHIYTEPGTYDVTLTVTTPEGCTTDSTFTQVVIVEPYPVAAFTASPQPTDVSNTTITFTDGSSSDVTGWMWDFDTIPPFNSNVENPVVNFPQLPGTYPVLLTVTNTLGCTDTVRAYIVINPPADLDMPNVFSPNGDGNNDAFVPLKYFGTKAYLTIFNRWGQLVYSTTNLGAGWNGHLSGNPAPEGTYFWMVDPVSGASNFEPKHGYVTLLR